MVYAQEFQANEAQLSNLYTGKAYSPMQSEPFPSVGCGATTTFTRRCHSMQELSAIGSACGMPIVLPVSNTVDVAAANWSNTIGTAELAAVWTDPDFDAS